MGQADPPDCVDAEAFARLEKAGEIRLAPDLRVRLNKAIDYYTKLHRWTDAYSRLGVQLKQRTARRLREAEKDLRQLKRVHPAAYLSTVLDDDDAMVSFMSGEAEDVDQLIE